MLNHTERKLTATETICLVLTVASTTVCGVAPALRTTAVSTQVAQNSVEDPILGGFFELYTPVGYEEAINQIKRYMSANHADVKAVEAGLAKPKADSGKDEFVIYRGAFSVSTKTTVVSSNLAIVMRPELAKSAEELTAESYKRDMGDMTKLLDQAVEDKIVIPEQKESILKRINEDLAKLN